MVIHSKERTIAVIGAESSLVKDKLAPAFSKTMFPNTTFLPAYYNSPTDLPLPLAKPGWVDAKDLLTKLQTTPAGNPMEFGGVAIDGAILTVPSLHYSFASILASRLPVWVEAPICLPEETEKMTALVAQNPENIFAVDALMESRPFIDALHNGIFLDTGKLLAINGRMVTSSQINNPRLGMEANVHILTLIAATLKKLGIEQPLEVADVVLARYKLPREDCNPSLQSDYRQVDDEPALGKETYGWIRARAGTLPIFVDGGMGVDEIYCGIKVWGIEKRVAVSTNGMKGCKPYIEIEKGGKPHRTNFIKDISGYHDDLIYFLSRVHNLNPQVFPSLQDRSSACLSAVNVIEQAYKLFATKGKKITEYIPRTTPQTPFPVLVQI